MTVVLRIQDVHAIVGKTLTGNGGFQRLLRELQPMVKRDTPAEGLVTFTLEEPMARRIVRYVEHGDGGFQYRLRPLAAACRQQLAPLPPRPTQLSFFE